MARPEQAFSSETGRIKSTRVVLGLMASLGVAELKRRLESAVLIASILGREGSPRLHKVNKHGRTFRGSVDGAITSLGYGLNPGFGGDAHRMTFGGPDPEGLHGESSLFPSDKPL